MLYSIADVNEQFFAALQGITIHDAKTKTDKPVWVRYAKESSGDYTESKKPAQVYPCVVIADFTPRLHPDWYVDLHTYAGGLSRDGLTAYIYRRPIRMEFHFDVSIATKSYFDYVALKDFFLTHFQANTRLLLNKRLEGELEVGDIVPYEVRATDIPRNDGVFETNYEFTLSPWVTPITPEQVQVIQELAISANPKDFQ